MAKEIEFRFLCNHFIEMMEPNESDKIISQGYLHVDSDQQIRVRLINSDKAFICIKHMLGDGVERDEFEYEIPREDGEKLFAKCPYKFKKIRTSDKTLEGYPIDIDLYEDGTIIAEVELPSRETLFTKPMYFGDDITRIHKYCNYAFAGIPESAYQ